MTLFNNLAKNFRLLIMILNDLFFKIIEWLSDFLTFRRRLIILYLIKTVPQ